MGTLMLTAAKLTSSLSTPGNRTLVLMFDAAKKPVFTAGQIDSPDRVVLVSKFHRLSLGVPDVVADFVRMGGEIQIARGDGSAEEGRREDAHEEQYHDDFDDGESRWTAHRSTSQVWSFPRSVREGQRGGGRSLVYRIDATISPSPAESQ